MSKLLNLLKGSGGEESLSTMLGRWRQAVSVAGDLAASQLSFLVPDVVQLQVDVTAPGFISAYLTQSVWYVDSVTGNDANSALTALTAIKTLAELTRRFEGRTLSPAMATMDINLSGTFAEELVLNFASPAQTVITVTAPMTTVYSGTIGTFTAGVPTTNTRATLQDAGLVAATHLRRRVRLTSGA